MRVEAGDLVLCASGAGQGVLSNAIRWWTGSAFSHVQLVLSDVTAWGDFDVLEVGWRIRAAKASEVLAGREYVVYRVPLSRGERICAAEDGWRFLAELEAAGRTRYPWWKLPAYLLRRGTRARVLRAGPRQVCSVVSCNLLVTRGLEMWVWDSRRRGFDRIDTAGEIHAVTPGDLQRCAIEQGWRRVHETPGCPRGV